MSSASESGSDKVIFQKSAAGRCSQVLDDAEFVKMYDRTTSKTLNKSLISATNDNAQTAQKQQQNDETHKWKIGDQCMALYEADGKWYPAIIEEISPVKNKCTVSYVGYDQKAVLKLEEILADSDVEAADEVGNEHEAEGTSGTNKIVNNDVKKDAFPIPDLCPPPPPSMFGKVAVAGNEKEALTNMLMSWYMSGYHTGFYQGVMHEKMSCQKPK